MTQNGLREVDVTSPGFSTNCVDTLHQVSLNRASFLKHGSEELHSIPCLNDREDHIMMMADLVRPYI
jgi:ferrochelatase